MAEIITVIAEEKPAIDALIDEFWSTTWSAFDARTNQLIDALRGAGLAAGSSVGVLAGDRREYDEVLASCAHADTLSVPINWHLHAFDGSSLRIVWHGAAPCPPGVKRRMLEWWGPE